METGHGGTHHGQDVAAMVALVVIAGGGATAATQTDHTAPILAFIGALLVAVIAAVTASRRQAQQLAEDRARLAMQLEHDRQLSDVEHLRALLDQAAELYDQAMHAVVGVHVAYIANRGSDAMMQALNAAATAIQRTTNMHRRLQLRYDDAHPIVTAYDRIGEAFREAITKAPGAGATAALRAATSAFGQFSAASRSVIGTDASTQP